VRSGSCPRFVHSRLLTTVSRAEEILIISISQSPRQRVFLLAIVVECDGTRLYVSRIVSHFCKFGYQSSMYTRL
jgi:hypothetical protein